MLLSIISICGGACAGSLARWLFNSLLNPIFPALPLGTLAVNLLGSFIMGVMLALFALWPDVSSQARLLIVTGFLGSFTTFSAFAGEMASLFANGRPLLCAMGIGLHVAGSILLVFAGMGAVALVRKLAGA